MRNHIIHYTKFKDHLEASLKVLEVIKKYEIPYNFSSTKGHKLVYEGCSNMNASSFITFFTNML